MEFKTGDEVILFGSGASFDSNMYKLSNFWKSEKPLKMTWSHEDVIPKHLQGQTFETLTSEHMYQMFRTKNLESAKMFALGGKFCDY